MSEEELARAEEINRQREEEYRAFQEKKQHRIYNDSHNEPEVGAFICDNIQRNEVRTTRKPPSVDVVTSATDAVSDVTVAQAVPCDQTNFSSSTAVTSEPTTESVDPIQVDVVWKV